MSLCQDIGRWFTDNVEKPLERWRQRAIKECTNAQHWFEQLITNLEDWRRSQVTRCQEQACQWLCLCCNKWFCWLIDILIRLLITILQIIEHVVEAVCKLIVTLLWLLAWIIVQLIKLVALSVVCLLETFCSLFILLAGLALLVLLLGIVALGVPTIAPVATPLLPIAAAVAIGALLLAHRLCEINRCRILGTIGWALKWAIVLGAVLALLMLSPLSALIVTIYGGLIAALTVFVERIGCHLPRMLGLP